MIDASTISLLYLLGMTGKICLKSPLRTIVIPLKGLFSFSSDFKLKTSLNGLSRTSEQNFLAMGASSQMISKVLSKRLVS